jgi:hypothetical protein
VNVLEQGLSCFFNIRNQLLLFVETFFAQRIFPGVSLLLLRHQSQLVPNFALKLFFQCVSGLVELVCCPAKPIIKASLHP